MCETCGHDWSCHCWSCKTCHHPGRRNTSCPCTQVIHKPKSQPQPWNITIGRNT